MGTTYLHPCAGYIYPGSAHYYTQNWEPVPLDGGDIEHLRDLAKTVAEIASDPKYELKKQQWQKHNDLKPVRPMYICYAENGWSDIISDDKLKTESPFWREYEWYLTHLIYRYENIDDDFVIPREIISFVDHFVENANYGLTTTYASVPETGACVGYPYLNDFSDMKKMKTPSFYINEKTTNARYNALNDVFGDILDVKKYVTANFAANQPGILAGLRGIEQMMIDMYDSPEFLCELLEFITLGNIKILNEMKESGYIKSNIGNYYVDSGGNGFSNDMRSGSDSFENMWGFGVAQEFSEVSPEHHYEFGVKYQVRVMEMFGINSYGCCEPYTNKFDMLKKYIRNLRRISISSWCDARKAAENLKRDYILSIKPNPAVLLYETDRQIIKDYIKSLLNNTYGCTVELFLKDVINLKNRERNFIDSAKIIKESIKEAYDYED